MAIFHYFLAKLIYLGTIVYGIGGNLPRLALSSEISSEFCKGGCKFKFEQFEQSFSDNSLIVIKSVKSQILD